MPKELLNNLTDEEKHAVYQHLYERIAAYKNVSEYYYRDGLMTEIDMEKDNKKIEAFEKAIHDQMK